MVNLKKISDIPLRRCFTTAEREAFQEKDFHPDELLQLKEMDERELKRLLIFCGIRSYDGVPLVVMEEDEMRMAYVIWRADAFKQKQNRFIHKIERGVKWVTLMQNTLETMR